VNRRRFIGTLTSGILATSFAAEARSAARPWRIGWPYEGGATGSSLNVFREELRKLGYLEHRDYSMEPRFAYGHSQRLQDLAAELTRFPVDVLITGSTPAALAAMQATRTIPIVAIGVADPVASGLVRSFGQPGGNVTGTALALDEVSYKWLEVLKTVRTGLSRVAVLHNSTNPAMRVMLDPLQASARALTVALTFHDFKPAAAGAGVFDTMTRDRPHGIVVLPDAFIHDQHKSVVEEIARIRLPGIYPFSFYAFAGGLMGYGPNLVHMAGKAASYVDKIFKGARPGELPVERPTNFDLVINLKTAKALGLTIPQVLLLRADHLIE
jgi:putative ABC transport system substrate-binding protein